MVYERTSSNVLSVTVGAGSDTADAAVVVVPYDCVVMIYGSGATLHREQNFGDVAPTSGIKVYAFQWTKIGTAWHVYVNVGVYN